MNSDICLLECNLVRNTDLEPRFSYFDIIANHFHQTFILTSCHPLPPPSPFPSPFRIGHPAHVNAWLNVMVFFILISYLVAPTCFLLEFLTLNPKIGASILVYVPHAWLLIDYSGRVHFNKEPPQSPPQTPTSPPPPLMVWTRFLQFVLRFPPPRIDAGVDDLIIGMWQRFQFGGWDPAISEAAILEALWFPAPVQKLLVINNKLAVKATVVIWNQQLPHLSINFLLQ